MWGQAKADMAGGGQDQAPLSVAPLCEILKHLHSGAVPSLDRYGKTGYGSTSRCDTGERRRLSDKSKFDS